MQIYTIPITPVAGSRPRVTRFGSVYYPKKHTDFQKAMKNHLLNNHELLEILKSIERSGHLEVIFYLPIPKSISNKKSLSIIGNPHRHRPDTDNLIKILVDSLFQNDSMIWSIKAKKIYDIKGKIDILY